MAGQPPLIGPDSRNLWRGRAFAVRQKAWRTEGGERYNAPHSDIEPFAPAVLAAMFDSGVRIVGPVREYAYRVEPYGQTVRINVENWRWYVCDGTAEGRGLYELWAWRFALTVERAHAELWATLNAAADKERAACRGTAA